MLATFEMVFILNIDDVTVDQTVAHIYSCTHI